MEKLDRGFGKICASLSTNATRCDLSDGLEVGVLDSVRKLFPDGRRLKRVLTLFPSCFSQLS